MSDLITPFLEKHKKKTSPVRYAVWLEKDDLRKLENYHAERFTLFLLPPSFVCIL